MKPEYVIPINNEKYVYAYCRCERPLEWAIRIPKEKGKAVYPFKCDICGTEGEVWTRHTQRSRIMKMTLDEAIDCLGRDNCVGCRFAKTDESCLEMAHEIAIDALKKMREVENGETGHCNESYEYCDDTYGNYSTHVDDKKVVSSEEEEEYKEDDNKAFHCGFEESGFHAYNCNDCPNKCEEWG